MTTVCHVLPQWVVVSLAGMNAMEDRAVWNYSETGSGVDIAGNSLGATMALEAARRGLARSVVAISPPGLWKVHAPSQLRYIFGALRFAADSAWFVKVP